MAYTSNKKPNLLTELTTVDNDDVIVIGDSSATEEVVKQASLTNFRKSAVKYSATAPTNAVDGELWVDTSTQLDLPVTSADITSIVSLTQAEYDALTPDANTLYVITT